MKKKKAANPLIFQALRLSANYSNSSRGFYRYLINADISHISGDRFKFCVNYKN